MARKRRRADVTSKCHSLSSNQNIMSYFTYIHVWVFQVNGTNAYAGY